jgi:hypothetical protein
VAASLIVIPITGASVNIAANPSDAPERSARKSRAAPQAKFRFGQSKRNS